MLKVLQKLHTPTLVRFQRGLNPHFARMLSSAPTNSSHTTTIKMPSIMDSVEGTVLEWLKNEGENISEGESICRVEVGDLYLEIEAPFDGLVADILVEAHNPVAAESEIVILCKYTQSPMGIRKVFLACWLMS